MTEREAKIAAFQELYLNGTIDGVSLVATGSDACGACLAVTDRAYLPSQLPALPLDGCTDARGCRCRYEPNVTVYE